MGGSGWPLTATLAATLLLYLYFLLPGGRSSPLLAATLKYHFKKTKTDDFKAKISTPSPSATRPPARFWQVAPWFRADVWWKCGRWRWQRWRFRRQPGDALQRFVSARESPLRDRVQTDAEGRLQRARVVRTQEVSRSSANHRRLGKCRRHVVTSAAFCYLSTTDALCSSR